MAKYRPFGDAPIDLAQDVRASPPSPSQANLPPPGASAQQLANRQPVRASPRMPPRVVNRGTFQKVPVTAILQGGGMNGAPIQATNINGAPVMVDPMNRPGSLAAVNMDTSVSAQVRGAKMLGALRADGVQVSNDYTDAIRNAAGFAFGPKRMPKQGFMAASYSYPAQQMVVGATLAGTPIVNPQPTRGASPAAAPKLVTRGGIRGQISSSPSEDRRRLLSTLQGLAAAPNVSWVAEGVKTVEDYGKGDWGINIRTFIDSLPDYVPMAVREEAKGIASKLSSAPVPWSLIANNIGAPKIGYGIFSLSLPPFIKEAYIKWAYNMTWKAPISVENLKRAMGAAFTSAQNLAAVVAHPSYDPSYKSKVDRTQAEVDLFIARMNDGYKRIHGCFATEKRLGEWRAWAYETSSSKMFSDAMAATSGIDFLVKTFPDTPENTAKRAFCRVEGSGGDVKPPMTTMQPQFPVMTTMPPAVAKPAIPQAPAVPENKFKTGIINSIVSSGETSLPKPVVPRGPVVLPPALPAVPPPPPPAMMPMPDTKAPAAGGSNTMLIVGGVAVLAAVAFIATRK
jgi:hypothetical protein